MSRTSGDIGAAFEAVVNKWHVMAGLRGALTHVIHNMPPSKYIKGNLIYEQAGVADFTGCLHGGGFLASEAKSVAPGERLQKSRVSATQQQHLDAVTAAGGNSLAFLLVEFRVEFVPNRASYSIPAVWYAIPWHEVPWRVVRTAESLDEVDIASHYRVLQGTDYLVNYHNGSKYHFVVGERRKHVHPRE